MKVDAASESIDLSFDVLFLRVDLNSISKNILPIPRSLKPSFYDKMSPFLRVFNPHFNISHDRKTGLEVGLDVSANLLELPRLWKGEETSESKYRFEMKFSGRKSVYQRFYQSKTDLTLSRIQSGKVLEKLAIGASYQANDQPLDKLRFTNNRLKIEGEIKLRPRAGYLNTVYLGGSYGGGGNRVSDASNQRVIDDRDRRFAFRSIIDGRLFAGFARTALWIENNKSNASSTSYRRVAGTFGFQKDLGKGTQTVGVEGIVGGGKTWGNAPIYARFFGGNGSQNFLYESPDSSLLSEFPNGPLLRSYGKTQAASSVQNGTAVGGRSYWHTNLNVTIPIPSWSRRLIPDDIVDDFDDNGNVIKRTPLNQILENFTIGSAIGGIGSDLLDPIIEDLMRKDATLTAEEAEALAIPIAQKQAEKIVSKEIAPTIRFVARHANLFAVKPLLMFDAARVSGELFPGGRTRFALGGGLQFVLVIARAEMGYMFSRCRSSTDSKGNLVFRITFQNLF